MQAVKGRYASLPGYTPAIPLMAAAVLLLPLLGAGAMLAAPHLTRGNFRAAEVLAVNHLATLGWGTLVAMGALYHLFPAMLGASVRPDRRVLPQVILSASGAVLVVAGFLARLAPLVVLGGFATAAGLVVFLWLLMRALPQRRRWSLPATGVALALGALGLTVVWGLVLGVNRHHAFWPSLLGYAGVGTHAALGLGGWFAQLIISVSYFLLPRFMGARDLGEGRLRLVLWLLNAGVVAFVVAALWGPALLARAGAVLLAAAGLLYASDLWTFLRGTRGDRPDLTTHHWWVIWAETVILCVAGAGWGLGLLPVEGRRVATGAGGLVLLGWMTLAVMGQLYKVTPFLMWFYRYAQGLTPYEIPRLEAPYYPRAGVPAFYLSAAGGAVFAGGIVVQRSPVSVLGGACLLAGALLFWYLMAVSWLRAAAGAEPFPPIMPA
jgi:hypothetical protein